MSERDVGPPDLAPEAVERLAKRLRERNALRPPRAEPLDLSRMVRHLCGALAPDEAQEIVRRLNVDPAARRRLIEADDCMEALKGLSETEVKARAQADDLTGQVAREWLALRAEIAAAQPAARELWMRHGWEAIRRQMEEGVAEARTAWQAFQQFAASEWTRFLNRPRLALARDLERIGVLGELPPGIHSVETEVTITEEGALHVFVEFIGAPERLEGWRVRLDLQSGEAWWPLASGTVEKGQVEWRLPDFTSALAEPVTSVPPDSLRLVLDSPRA